MSAIELYDIEPDTEGMTKEYRWYEDSYIKLPDVRGMSSKDAAKLLKEFKLEYSGSGDTVLYMSPEPNYYVKKGGTIKIMLKDLLYVIITKEKEMNETYEFNINPSNTSTTVGKTIFLSQFFIVIPPYFINTNRQRNGYRF